MRHVVDAVQVGAALLVVHVLPLRAHDLEGIRAEEQLAGLPGQTNSSQGRRFMNAMGLLPEKSGMKGKKGISRGSPGNLLLSP